MTALILLAEQLESGVRTKVAPQIGPAAKVGARYRLTPGGPVHTTVRATTCAAYARHGIARPHPDPVRAAAGETINSSKVDPISLRSAVWPENA